MSDPSTSAIGTAASAIHRERSPEGVETIRLPPSPTKPRGGVVVLDRWLIGELDRALAEVAASRPAGVILASGSERVFVAGADLAEIDGLSDAELDAYLRAGADCFARLLAMPCPTVALVTGAALGGGLELALHCDALAFLETPAGGKPYPVGLPEASLGICPGWGGTQTLPARIDPAIAIERTSTGTPWKSDALPTGLAAFSDPDRGELLRKAHAWIAGRSGPAAVRPIAIGPVDRGRIEAALDGLDAGASDGAAATNPDLPTPRRAVLAAVRHGLAYGFAEALAEERRQLIRLRGTAETKAKLAAFLSKNA
jgi:enoyl-CoA hydratase/carnithine racemase